MKIVMPVAKPVIASVRAHWALRDADTKQIRLGGVDAEINGALDLLARNASTAPRALVQFVKGKISDRPEVFDEVPVPQWLATDRTRELVRQAVYAYIDDRPVQPYLDEAASFFAEFDGADGPGRGYAALEYALPYALLGIASSLGTGDRLILDAVHDVGAKVGAAIAPLPVELLDADIATRLDRLRRGRFFEGTGHREETARLGARIHDGDLSRASEAVRAAALATCARYLARGEDRPNAERLLAASIGLAATEEAVCAKAVLLAIDDADAGLAHLAPIATDARRLAALGIVGRRVDPPGIVDWADAAGIDRDALDSDGRHVLLLSKVEAGRWDAAFADLDALTPEDLARTPALGHVAATAHVARVVPVDLRRIVVASLPFDPAGFPLADTPEALAERRVAARLWRDASRAASELGADATGHVLLASALWLELRDPGSREQAAWELADHLDGGEAVRWIPLAIAFGVVTDISQAERAVSRAETLNPAGSGDLAAARLAIARAKPTPGGLPTTCWPTKPR